MYSKRLKNVKFACEFNIFTYNTYVVNIKKISISYVNSNIITKQTKILINLHIESQTLIEYTQSPCKVLRYK